MQAELSARALGRSHNPEISLDGLQCVRLECIPTAMPRWGPLTLYRNVPKITELFRHCENLYDIFNSEMAYFFDEWGGGEHDSTHCSMTNIISAKVRSAGTTLGARTCGRQLPAAVCAPARTSSPVRRGRRARALRKHGGGTASRPSRGAPQRHRRADTPQQQDAHTLLHDALVRGCAGK